MQDLGRVAGDAYTYMHVPIVVGVVAVAVGDDLVVAEPGQALHGVALAMVAVLLTALALFEVRTSGAPAPARRPPRALRTVP